MDENLKFSEIRARMSFIAKSPDVCRERLENKITSYAQSPKNSSTSIAERQVKIAVVRKVCDRSHNASSELQNGKLERQLLFAEELIPKKAQEIKAKPLIAQKPAKKHTAVIPGGATPVQKPVPASKPVKNLQHESLVLREKRFDVQQTVTIEDQQPSLVNRIRQQFEQHTTLERQFLEGITPSFGQNQASTWRKITIAPEDSLNLKSPYNTDFQTRVSENQQVSNFKSSSISFVDEQEFSDDEFDFYEDLSKFPSKAPRQRASYAEAPSAVSTSSQLKQSMSFNQSPHGRNQIDPNIIKCNMQLRNIMQELIETEENYIRILFTGITNYRNMFAQKDLPRGLQGKEFQVFGPIERIAVFHRDILLPMLRTNRKDLTKLFIEFLGFVQNHYMFDYVLYTINKRRSQEIVDKMKPYFVYIQEELGEKLGIESFLLQHIQRLPRYSLLLKEFLKAYLVANVSRDQIKSCCALETAICKLLDTTNEAAKIGDIIDWSSLNLFHPCNAFHKVLELYIFDFERNRGYASKVFVFAKCMIYTEVISEKDLVYRGGYDALKAIDLIAAENSFRMSQHGCQLLELRSNSSEDMQHSLKFIKQMIDSNSKDETTSSEIIGNTQTTSTDRSSAGVDSGLD